MPQKFTSDAPSFDEIRAMRKPRTETVWVPLDTDLMERVEDLEKQIRIEERADEREHRRAVAPKLKAELEELLDEAENCAVPFVLTELPRKLWRTLIDLHPATEADKARGVNRWSEDGIAPALIAACCTSPALTTIDRDEFLKLIHPAAKPDALREHIGPAIEVWDEWAASVAYLLFTAAYELQEGGSKIPFTVRNSNGTTDSPPSSNSAPDTSE